MGTRLPVVICRRIVLVCESEQHVSTDPALAQHDARRTHLRPPLLLLPALLSFFSLSQLLCQQRRIRQLFPFPHLTRKCRLQLARRRAVVRFWQVQYSSQGRIRVDRLKVFGVKLARA